MINEKKEKYREITKEYEFENVITFENIIKDNVIITSFRQLILLKIKNFKIRNYNEIVIEIIFVFINNRD